VQQILAFLGRVAFDAHPSARTSSLLSIEAALLGFVVFWEGEKSVSVGVVTCNEGNGGSNIPGGGGGPPDSGGCSRDLLALLKHSQHRSIV
jgi:hypothetical protein